MTLAELIEPCTTVLIHSDVKGLEIGAGIGAAFCIPTLALKPSLVNAADDPPLVAVAKCAGTGAVIGGFIAVTMATVKMSNLKKEEIVTRSEKIRANSDQRLLDRIAIGGVGVGLGFAGLRFSEIAKATEHGSIAKVVASKDGAWETFCFSVLGASIAVGAFSCGKAILRAVNKQQQGGNGAADGGTDCDAVAAVEQAVDDATAATENAVNTANDAAKDAADTVKADVGTSGQ